MATFTQFEKLPNVDTVVGTTDSGARVAFENEKQFTDSGGQWDKIQINPNLNLADATAFSAFNVPQAPVAPRQAIPADTLGMNFTPQDARAMIDSARKLQEEYLASLKPTEEETALQNELRTATQQDRAALQRTATGLDILGGQEIPLGLIRGQQGQLVQQAERQSQTRSLERQALAENLSALVGQRQTRLDGLKAAIGFGQQNLEQVLGIEQYFRALNREAQQDARATLESVLKLTNGLSWSELDEETRNQLTQVAVTSNLPLDAIRSAVNAPSREIGRATGQPFFVGPDGRTIYDSATGEWITNWDDFIARGGNADMSNVASPFTSPDQQAEKEMVQALAANYIDAGISLDDSLAAAQQKIIRNSAIYRNAVTRSGGGGAESTEELTFAGTPVSGNTYSVLSGLSGSFTPAAAQEVRADLARLGFGSDSAPDWFRPVAEQAAGQSLMPEALNKAWVDYRNGVVSSLEEGGDTSGGNISYDDV